MCHRRNLLFVAVILFTAPHRTVQTFTETKLKDMALDAVNEQYDGCREEALQAFVYSGLLREELNNSESFLKAWNRNAQPCLNPIDGGIKEHAVALSVFANEMDFVTTFDEAVETMRNNVSAYENFPYKSFLFLLTDAMRLLNSSVCKSLYFVEDEDNLKLGSSVRLGSFKTVYLSIASLGYDLDSLTVFNLISCFFVNLREHGCGTNKDMVLISPAEEFIVERESKKTHDDAEYTEFALKHSKVTSFNNCHRFSRSPAHDSTQWLVLLLLTLFLFVFYC